MKLYQAGTDGTIKPVEVQIPEKMSSGASGDYIVECLRERYPGVSIPVSTGRTVVFAAEQGAKEGLKLKSVKIGLNIRFFNLSFEWERKK